MMIMLLELNLQLLRLILTIKINFSKTWFITPSMLMSICLNMIIHVKIKEHLPGSPLKHYSINKEIYIIHNKNILKNISLENISVIEFGDTLSKSKNFIHYQKVIIM